MIISIRDLTAEHAATTLIGSTIEGILQTIEPVFIIGLDELIIITETHIRVGKNVGTLGDWLTRNIDGLTTRAEKCFIKYQPVIESIIAIRFTAIYAFDRIATVSIQPDGSAYTAVVKTADNKTIITGYYVAGVVHVYVPDYLDSTMIPSVAFQTAFRVWLTNRINAMPKEWHEAHKALYPA